MGILGSPAHNISPAEVSAFIKWSTIFLAPALLVFLLQIQAGADLRQALGAVETWALMRAIQFLSKWVPDTTQ